MNKKALLSIVLSMAMLLSMFSTMAILTSASGEELEEGDYRYTVQDSGAVIIDYIGEEPMVSVPATLGGYPVTTIGSQAFNDLDFIQSITLPEGLEIVEDSAFWSCSELMDITLPSTLRWLGNAAFDLCSSLYSISIPASVTYIGWNICTGCTSLQYIDVASDNTMYRSDNGVLVSKDSTQVIRFPLGVDCPVYDFPSNATSVENAAFEDCVGLSSVYFSEYIEYIPSLTFVNCLSLETIYLPRSLKTIDAFAFNYCPSLTTVIYGGTESEWNAIDIKEGNDELLNANFVFQGVEEETTITTTTTTTTTTITTTTTTMAPAPVTFSLSSVEDVSVGDIITVDVTVSENHYMMNGQIWVTYDPAALELQKVWDDADNPYFETVNTDIIKNTTMWAFDVPEAGTAKFAFATSASKGTTAGGTIFTLTFKVLDGIGYDGTAVSVEIPELQSSNGVYDYNPTVETADGFVKPVNPFSYKVNADGATCTITGYTGSAENVVIPSVLDGYTVTAIGSEAFRGCEMVSITIPDTVTSIGSGAFLYCTNLKSITIPDSVVNLGYTVFAHCYSLTDVKLPKNISVIGSQLFSHCESLERFIVPDTVKTIGYRAFNECANLTDITIPEGVTEIGAEAFAWCEQLTSIVVPDSIKAIGYQLFFGCENLTDVTLGKGIEAIGDGFAEGSDKLENVWYTGTADDWVKIAFSRYDANPMCGVDNVYFDGKLVTDVVLSEGVTDISGYAFYCSETLRSITIPGSIVTIEEGAFTGCNNLTEVVVCEGVTEIRDYLFASCSALKSVTLPDSVTTIDNSAFRMCRSLEELTLGNGLTTIGFAAFYGCDSLTEVVIPDSVAILDDLAFAYCDNLTSVTVPSTVTEIVDRAFMDCPNLTLLVYTDSCGLQYAIDNTIPYVILDPLHREGDYFYKGDKLVKAYQLVEFEGDLYFVNDYHKVAKNTKLYLTEEFVSGFTFDDGTPLSVGYYEFDANGKMIVKNGPVGDYFYKNNVYLRAYQLVDYKGDLYFVSDSHRLAKNTTLYLTQEFISGFTFADGTPLSVGYYEFDAEGKMIVKNGPVGDYFYKNNVRLKAYQLVEYNGDLYFVGDYHKLAKNTTLYLTQEFVSGFTFADGTPLAVGRYEFDTDGKMIVKNGPVGDYFYKNNVYLKAYQLVEFEGDYYFINDSHKLAKNKTLYLGSSFVDGTLLEPGYYTFDENGKLIQE